MVDSPNAMVRNYIQRKCNWVVCSTVHLLLMHTMAHLCRLVSCTMPESDTIITCRMQLLRISKSMAQIQCWSFGKHMPPSWKVSGHEKGCLIATYIAAQFHEYYRERASLVPRPSLDNTLVFVVVLC